LANFAQRLANFERRLAKFEQRLVNFEQRSAHYEQQLATLQQQLENFWQLLAEEMTHGQKRCAFSDESHGVDLKLFISSQLVRLSTPLNV
jgi:phage shock protein A